MQEKKITDRQKLDKKIQQHNWYQDRHSSIIIQRNFLALIVLVSIFVMLAGLIYINQISKNKSIEPFIVEIEEKTGIPTVVDQLSKKQYMADDIIQEYFLYQYINAREGYDIRDYRYNYFNIVRLLSSSNIFYSFYKQVSSQNDNSPINLYGREVKLVAKIKSIQNIDDAKQVRVLIQHIKFNTVIKEEHKIIFLKYIFANMELSFEDRLINPLGFQVVDYKINDDYGASK